MIVELLLKAITIPFFYAITALLEAIPDIHFLADLQTPIQEAFDWAFSVMMAVDPIIPYSTQLVVLGAVITYYFVLQSFRVISFILRKIPFVNES